MCLYNQPVCGECVCVRPRSHPVRCFGTAAPFVWSGIRFGVNAAFLLLASYKKKVAQKSPVAYQKSGSCPDVRNCI